MTDMFEEALKNRTYACEQHHGTSPSISCFLCDMNKKRLLKITRHRAKRDALLNMFRPVIDTRVGVYHQDIAWRDAVSFSASAFYPLGASQVMRLLDLEHEKGDPDDDPGAQARQRFTYTWTLDLPSWGLPGAPVGLTRDVETACGLLWNAAVDPRVKHVEFKKAVRLVNETVREWQGAYQD